MYVPLSSSKHVCIFHNDFCVCICVYLLQNIIENIFRITICATTKFLLKISLYYNNTKLDQKPRWILNYNLKAKSMLLNYISIII